MKYSWEVENSKYAHVYISCCYICCSTCNVKCSKGWVHLMRIVLQIYICGYLYSQAQFQQKPVSLKYAMQSYIAWLYTVAPLSSNSPLACPHMLWCSNLDLPRSRTVWVDNRTLKLHLVTLAVSLTWNDSYQSRWELWMQYFVAVHGLVWDCRLVGTGPKDYIHEAFTFTACGVEGNLHVRHKPSCLIVTWSPGEAPYL